LTAGRCFAQRLKTGHPSIVIGQTAAWNNPYPHSSFGGCGAYQHRVHRHRIVSYIFRRSWRNWGP